MKNRPVKDGNLDGKKESLRVYFRNFRTEISIVVEYRLQDLIGSLEYKTHIYL